MVKQITVNDCNSQNFIYLTRKEIAVTSRKSDSGKYFEDLTAPTKAGYADSAQKRLVILGPFVLASEVDLSTSSGNISECFATPHFFP